jgi:hypothetical protein
LRSRAPLRSAIRSRFTAPLQQTPLAHQKEFGPVNRY